MACRGCRPLPSLNAAAAARPRRKLARITSSPVRLAPSPGVRDADRTHQLGLLEGRAALLRELLLLGRASAAGVADPPHDPRAPRIRRIRGVPLGRARVCWANLRRELQIFCLGIPLLCGFLARGLAADVPMRGARRRGRGRFVDACAGREA